MKLFLCLHGWTKDGMMSLDEVMDDSGSIIYCHVLFFL